MIYRTRAAKFFHKTELCSFEEICSGVLSFCNSKSLREGVCVHSPIIKLGLHNDLYLNNNLLSLYGKCFGVENARHWFDEMPHRDVVSWTGLMSAYDRNENFEEILKLFGWMMFSGLYPNEYTFSIVLRLCSSLGEFNQGTRIQAYMIKGGYESNPILASNLIGLYSNCNYTEEAYKVFNYMDNGDIVSWTTMISSFVEAQNWSQALWLYHRMIEAGVCPNGFTFLKLLTASSFLGLDFGKSVHAHLIMRGIKLNLVLKTSLVDMYAKFRRMEDALKVSNQTVETDAFLWTTIISGFVQNSTLREAIAAFHQMEISGTQPNNFTYSGILNACSSALSLDLGKQVHSRVIMACLEDDVSVGNALIDMYIKCSHQIEYALTVFRGITSPNVISWTTLIAGFAEHGLENNSFQAFVEMQVMGVQPNSFTLSTILGACSKMKSPTQTKKLHGYIIKTKVDYDIVVGNALVNTYAGVGMVKEALDVVAMMNHRDTITYTSLATRINQMGHPELALSIIARMSNDNVQMDEFSLACFLSASAGLATIETGRQLHCYSVKSGFGSWISVSNGLVDLYGKCGCTYDTQRAFREITEPDVVSWNGLIHGLASNGCVSSALSAFDNMRLTRVKPDSITFLIVLFACSQGGLVDLGLEYFQSMDVAHDIEPQMDHYICLIDLLGRSGRLEEAMGVLETMPFKPDSLVYKALLSACKLHGNIPLGEEMARQGVLLDPADSAFYVLLATMYDDSGRPDLGESVRKMKRERGLSKNRGQSWMEMRNHVHLFAEGIDNIHESMRFVNR